MSKVIDTISLGLGVLTLKPSKDGKTLFDLEWVKESDQEPQYTPEYLTALAKLNESTNHAPGLTAKQQFILELLKAQIAANGGVSEQSVKMAMRATDQVFGE